MPTTQFKTPIVLGLDLGGTNTRVAAVSFDGQVLARAAGSTPHRGSADEIIGVIEKLANDCIDVVAPGQISGLGAAVPATFKAGSGVLGGLPNLPGLQGVDLNAELEARFGVPVELANDATAATIGEHWLGASKGYRNVIGVTLGTGVGGGIILNNEVFEGPDGTAGEIGHVCLDPDGIHCGCGSQGCFEQYASGTAIVRAAAERGLTVATPRDLFTAAEDGNAVAIETFSEMGRYIGVAVAGYINFLNPDAVVIGGGVSASWPHFISTLTAEVKKRAFPEPASRVKIIRASLGDDAGVLGAAKLTFKKLGRS